VTTATHEDAKALGYCNRGLRRWFEGRELTFDDFRREGATVEWLRRQADAMADRLADYAERQEAGRGR
jgi:hypothetical protein